MFTSGSSTQLKLLCTLRWLGIAGQAVTVLAVTHFMGIGLLQWPLWSGITAVALFNLYATWRSRVPGQPGNAEVFAHVLVDILALAWMVGWSGGVENPFSSLFLLPIALSVLVLPGRWVWAAAAASIGGYIASALLARPLPHVHGDFGDLFSLHKAGMFVTFAVSVVVVLIFFTRMTAAWRQSEREVARLRERFARNEGIVALATHAASVAHELNTPLGTLTLMVEDLAADATEGARREEYATMRALLDVCRDRVKELARPADVSAGAAGTGVELARLIEHWQLVRPAIDLRCNGLRGRVDPAVGHLLQALLNNAADASEAAGSRRVDLAVHANGQGLRASVRDYGAGFAHASAGLPGTLFRTDKPQGLGIGLALSHATVERLGGQLSMQAASEGAGVVVSFHLPAAVIT